MYRLFAPFGAILAVDLQPDRNADMSRAFIHFRLRSDAEYMLKQIDWTTVGGKLLTATMASP